MITRILIIDQVRSESLSFRRMNDEASPHVTTTNISGKWNANKENSELTTSDIKANSDGDKYIGAAFITGITNAISYKGSDENNLYIHYKNGQRSFFLAFKPK